jgi:hypothetical protein
MSDVLSRHPASGGALLRLNLFEASSLLQKAIRRGEAGLAESAMVRLYRLRSLDVAARLLAIAFEDVGIGSVKALVKTVAVCADASASEGALCGIARLLAKAPKDRSASHLAAAAKSHPIFEDARRIVGESSYSECLDLIAEDDASLPVRAIAALRCSGLNWNGGRGERSDPIDWTLAFGRLGVPAELLLATRTAFIRAHKPAILMAPLLWLDVNRGFRPSVTECQMPEAAAVDGVPLYIFDGHTAIGRRAIQRFTRESQPVRDALRSVLSSCTRDVAFTAVFYADGAPVARRLKWEGAAALEALGVEAEMLRVETPLVGVAPVLAAFRDNLGHLNMIRARLFCGRYSGSSYSSRILRRFR